MTAVDRHFGEQLRSTRKRLSVSQRGLIESLRRRYDLAWHQSTVAKVESGARPVGLSEAVAVAAVLGVELDSLIRPDVREPDSDQAAAAPAVEFGARLRELTQVQQILGRRERQLREVLASP